MIDNNILGKRIRNDRKKAGLKQAGLAEMLNVTDCHISNLERGV